MTWQETKTDLLAKIRTECAAYKDETTSIGNLAYLPDPNRENKIHIIKDGNYQPLNLGSHAFSQLMNKIGIPVKYINKCPETLRDRNINYWLDKHSSKDILIRSGLVWVRAIFSTRFSTELDDHHIFPLFFQAIESYVAQNDLNIEDILIARFVKTDDVTVCEIEFQGITATHNDLMYCAGIGISNSEVGKASLQIRPAVMVRNNFCRFPIVDKVSTGVTTLRHVTSTTPEDIEEAVKIALEAAQVGVYKTMEANNEIVEKPVEEVKELVDESQYLSSLLVDAMEEKYAEEQHVSKLELCTSMLEAIKDLPLFAKHLAEREIGHYIDLFDDIDVKYDNICDDLIAINE